MMISQYWLIHFIAAVILFNEYCCQTTQSPVENGSPFETSLIEAMESSGYGEKTWFISPSSIKTVLEELYVGAGGDTKNQLASGLHLSKDTATANGEIAKEQTNLEETPQQGVSFQSANRILIRDSFTVNSTYKSQLVSIFHTDIQSASFADPAKTANDINSWVSNKTHGLITNLINPDDIEPSTIMVLLNALYFKGIWKYSFKPSDSTDKCFYSQPGKCTMKTMMTQERLFKYGENKKLGAKVISLPYKDERYTMVIVLPDSYNGLAEVINKLPNVQLLSFIKNLDVEHISLTMPKFTTTFKATMNEPLEKMGLQSIFQPRADFSSMTKEGGIYVSKVVHQAYISVAENGTIASAATGAIMARNMDSLPPEYIPFNVDHPSIFYILFNNTQILFTGQLY